MKQFILALLFCATVSFGQESIFKKGNSAYASADYASALEYYQQIESNDLESTELYFNIANSYFKLNEIGKAILYYEKAKKLSPLNEAVLANLALAKKKVLDDIVEVDQLYIFDLYQELKFSFTINEWLIYALSFFTFIFLCLFIKRWANLGALTNILLAFGIVFFVISAAFATVRIANFESKEGVVISATSEVYTSPTEYNQAFVLHEGSSFEIKRELNGRFEISLIDGKTGWINASDIGVI
jgi:tetratricopeptide (TPR) repeat protein